MDSSSTRIKRGSRKNAAAEPLDDVERKFLEPVARYLAILQEWSLERPSDGTGTVRNLNSHEEPRPSATCRKTLIGTHGGHVRPCFIQRARAGFSIPAQRKLLTEYAEREGIHVVQEFEDVETAKHAGRTSLGEMVAFLRKNGSTCRTILVERTDRLYRNIKDWVTIDELGIEVNFVKEAVVLSEDSRSSEKFMHGIKVLMGKNYIDNLGEEVRKGMIEKARQGHWPTVAPVGYVNNAATHRIEPDPDRAPIVVKLFEWYASGEYSLKVLTKRPRQLV